MPGYYGIGHNSLADYIAIVSRQAPTIATQADCGLFVDVLPGTPAPNGQVVGQGCVSPPSVQTIAGQLDSRRLTCKGCMEDLSGAAARDRTANDLGRELGPRPNLAAPDYAVPPGPFGAPCGTPAPATEEEWAFVLELARSTGWPV